MYHDTEVFARYLFTMYGKRAWLSYAGNYLVLYDEQN